MQARGIERQPSHGTTERGSVRRGGKNALQHNNGMHPTAKSAAFIRETPCLIIRETPCLIRCVRGG